MNFVKLIKTKYIGPTNFKGSRIKATSDCGKSVTLGWDSALDAEHNAINAVETLIERHALRLEVTGLGSFDGEYFVTVKFNGKAA
jgi:hypothetical protein